MGQQHDIDVDTGVSHPGSLRIGVRGACHRPSGNRAGDTGPHPVKFPVCVSLTSCFPLPVGQNLGAARAKMPSKANAPMIT